MDEPQTTKSLFDLTKPQGLRLLQSLRYGLPPVDAVEYLTVGYSETVPVIERLLRPSDPSSARWMMVKGNYGEGKSHFLRVFRNLAHKRGYASCYLCADAGTSALNHPQRFLSTLLSTLEVPNTTILGYYGLLMELLLDINTLQWVYDSCTDEGEFTRAPFGLIADILRALMNPERYGMNPNDDFAAALRHHAANNLMGTTIGNRASSLDVRHVAYRLLKGASHLVKKVGCRGLVILLDETESIFTKLPTSLSRDGALRVLSALCESPLLESCHVVMAITPDAYGRLCDQLRREMPSRLQRIEVTPKFSSRVLAGSSVLNCPRVNPRDARVLAERVREIYTHVHNIGVNYQEHRWSSFVSTLNPASIPTRLLLRQTVDFLDASRFATDQSSQ